MHQSVALAMKHAPPNRKKHNDSLLDKGIGGESVKGVENLSGGVEGVSPPSPRGVEVCNVVSLVLSFKSLIEVETIMLGLVNPFVSLPVGKMVVERFWRGERVVGVVRVKGAELAMDVVRGAEGGEVVMELVQV